MRSIQTIFARNLFAFLLSLSALVFAGCDSGSNSSDSSSSDSTSTYSKLRLVNATAATGLTMNGVGVTDTTFTFNSGLIASGSASDYVSKAAQSYTTGITATPSSLTAATQTLALASSTSYTLVAYARSGAINAYLLTDNITAPSAGFASLQVANAAGDAGTLDIYLVSPGASLNGITPTFASVTGKNSSVALTLTAGTYDIVVTAAGKPNDVRLAIANVTLASTDIVTLALTSTRGGGLVDGALVKQGGAVVTKPTTVARVRMVGAFPASGGANAVINATIGGISLGNLTAPSVGVYKLINGGTSTYTVNVNGTAVATLPVQSFANGGDYTILVYGQTTAPIVSVLVDNNQPSNNGYANLRLVNAAVTNGGITLYDNYLPLNIDVQYGETSAYAPTTPLSTSLLQIASPIAAFPGYTATDVNIASNGVYTVFVLGSTTAPVVSLSKDR